MAFNELVFSGVQPTGNLHLGNYLGAIVKFVALQERYSCIYCVVDLHALTQPMSVWGGPKGLAHNTREVTAAYLAAGIDSKRNIVFNQSQVHQHAELAWIFNCVARMGSLARLTQLKSKAGKNRENAVVGLFTYPHLITADNLVGIDAALANASKATVLGQFGGGQFSTFKSALVDLSVAKLGPIGAEMKRLVADAAYIDSVLADGAARASSLAEQTMKSVKDIIGFIHR